MRPPPPARPPLFSPRQRNLFRRLTAFALRFWPMWSVWLLILTIPVSREVSGLHFLGSPLATLYDQPWRKSFGRGAEFDGFHAARKHPRDLNARLWRLSLMMRGLGDDFNQKSYKPEELLREANAIRAAFPREKWLVALPVHVVALRGGNWPNHTRVTRGLVPPNGLRPLSLGITSSRSASRQMVWVRQGAALEPKNAFYPLVEAQIWRSSDNLSAMGRALRRAARCSFLDTHEAEWARRIIAAHGAIRPLLLEEKEAIWRENNTVSQIAILQDGSNFWRFHARDALRRGNHRRALEIGTMMARLGDLMQRGKNTAHTARLGHNWKNAAWSIAPLPRLRGRGQRAQSGDFARYAALHGRKDVAALVPKWAARQRELRHSIGNSPRWAPHDALWRAAWWRDAGAFVALHGVFIAAFWLAANLFLWRAQGAPSTSRARALPALFWALLASALAWWTWLQFDQFDDSKWTMAQAFRQIASGSVGVFAFFAAPFVFALWCAWATIAKNKSRFSLPTRVQTELRLYPVESGLFKAGATTLCALAIAATFAFWAVFLVPAWNGTASIDLTGWLPDAANGASLSFPIPTPLLFAPLFYCLLLDAICFLLWFAKWRWFGGRENRALTHGGLRGWKESLGVYLVFVSVIYLGTTLVSWPSRAAAHRELELRLTRGELPAANQK